MNGDSKVLGEAQVAATGRMIDDPNRIRIGWGIVKICAIAALIVLFNFFPERIGVMVSLDDPTSFVPLLAPEFGTHMPWLDLWWGLALALNVVHLVFRRWHPATRWADLGLSVLGVIILFLLVVGGPIVGLNPAWVAEQSLADGTLVQVGQHLAPALSVIVKSTLLLSLLLAVVLSGDKLARLLCGKWVDAGAKPA